MGGGRVELSLILKETKIKRKIFSFDLKRKKL
jgi:hypothetical protein